MSLAAKVRSVRFLRAAAGTVAIGLIGVSPALASGMNLIVGHCPGSNYPTIQSAVTAATPNSHITVCPGIYPEQVNIPAGKGRLVIQGQNNPVIEYPPVGEAPSGPNGSDDVVAITTGAGDAYQLSGFVIQGPWNDDPSSSGRHFGVYDVGSGTAQINQDTIQNIEDANAADRSNSDGYAVSFGDSALFNNGAEVPGNGTVNNSTIQSYQFVGAEVAVRGSNGTVNNDTITGPQIANSAPSGVVVGDGASASVHNNTVTNNVDTTADPANDLTQGDGIFVGFVPGSVNLNNNNLDHNDDGLDLNGASNVLSSNDKLLDNNFDGIHIDAQDPFGDPSASNTLSNDHASGNGAFDCQDDTHGSGTAGTADSWIHDHGVRQSPSGICHK